MFDKWESIKNWFAIKLYLKLFKLDKMVAYMFFANLVHGFAAVN